VRRRRLWQDRGGDARGFQSSNGRETDSDIDADDSPRLPALRHAAQSFRAISGKVELLSRFRSSKEQKEIVKQVEAGEVDVAIGTHRLLSKDVRFKDLGLVVVDEEQRFGVAHKEKLKQLKKRVDVLTLSATPIPGTLNMSLTGLRDMSLIETPPRDRLAIQTQVVQFSENVIKSAIELELVAGGQVFLIHNRVETIETIAALVQRLVPQARMWLATAR
jgi:transcription-repair coupling factor (superfamily II helicase)